MRTHACNRIVRRLAAAKQTKVLLRDSTVTGIVGNSCIGASFIAAELRQTTTIR
jgi:hypothetical protein